MPLRSDAMTDQFMVIAKDEPNVSSTPDTRRSETVVLCYCRDAYRRT